MTDTTKYHKLQDSSDDHNNNNIDLLDFDQPPPDYNQPRKPNQPPQYLGCTMYPFWPSKSVVEAYTLNFFLLVLLGTFINIATSLLMLHGPVTLKWQIGQLIAPLLQNLYNIVRSMEFCNGNLENGNLENGNLENGNLENGNLEDSNQKKKNFWHNFWHNFWPLWIYSAPMLVTMTVVFALQAPIAKVIAMSAHISINIAFLLTVINRSDRALRQDLNTGPVGKIVLGMIAILLLAGGIAEKVLG